MEFSSSGTGVRYTSLYKNGSQFAIIAWEGSPSGSNSTIIYGGTSIDLKAGDYLEFYAYQSSGGNLDICQSGEVLNHVSIERVSGPEQIQAGEKVVMMATSSSTATADSTTPIVYETVVKDTHAGLNTSTGRYTVPVAGVYLVKGSYYTSTADYGYVYKNGTLVS